MLSQQLAAFLFGVLRQRKDYMNAPSLMLNKQKIIYVSPSSEVVEQYAQKVCTQMLNGSGQQKSDFELVRDFTQFIKVVVKIQTNYMNAGG